MPCGPVVLSPGRWPFFLLAYVIAVLFSLVHHLIPAVRHLYLLQLWLLPFVGIHLKLGCYSSHGGSLCGPLSVKSAWERRHFWQNLLLKLATLISPHAFGLLFRGLKMLPIDLV